MDKVITKLLDLYKYNSIYFITKDTIGETGDFIKIRYDYGEHFIPISEIKNIEFYHSDSVSINFINGGHLFIKYDSPFTSLSY